MTVHEYIAKCKNIQGYVTRDHDYFLAEDQNGKTQLVSLPDTLMSSSEAVRNIGDWTVLKEILTRSEFERQQFLAALPDPKFKPDRDMVLCVRIEQTIGGIYLPETAEQPSQICRVLAVGDGLLLDCGQVRKSSYQRGDRIYTTPKDGFEIIIDGAKFWVFEAMEIVGKFLNEGSTAYGAQHC